MVGAESLLRWHYPELGDVAPADFIPVTEETGLTHGIGQWVFERACASLARWLYTGVPFRGHLSVNVSPWQFARQDFADRVHQSLLAHELDPRYMVLELTESALLYDPEGSINKLLALRAYGFKVSLDDFGTGYSSFAYLKDLPLDIIKIDKAFVDELSTAHEHPLAESLIAIGRYRQLDIIAEGVELPPQREMLIGLGCDKFQGHLFSRPLPEKDFLEWVAQNADKQVQM